MDQIPPAPKFVDPAPPKKAHVKDYQGLTLEQRRAKFDELVAQNKTKSDEEETLENRYTLPNFRLELMPYSPYITGWGPFGPNDVSQEYLEMKVNEAKKIYGEEWAKERLWIAYSPTPNSKPVFKTFTTKAEWVTFLQNLENLQRQLLVEGKRYLIPIIRGPYSGVYNYRNAWNSYNGKSMPPQIDRVTPDNFELDVDYSLSQDPVSDTRDSSTRN